MMRGNGHTTSGSILHQALDRGGGGFGGGEAWGVVESEMGARVSRSPGDGDAGSPGRIERGDHLGASGISGEGGAGSGRRQPPPLGRGREFGEGEAYSCSAWDAGGPNSGPSCGREIDDGKGSDGGGNTF